MCFSSNPFILELCFLVSFSWETWCCSPCFGLNSFFSVAGSPLDFAFFRSYRFLCAASSWASSCPDIKLMGENLSKFQRSDAKRKQPTGKMRKRDFCSTGYCSLSLGVYQLCEKWSKADKKHDLFSLIQCWCMGLSALVLQMLPSYFLSFSPRIEGPIFQFFFLEFDAKKSVLLFVCSINVSRSANAATFLQSQYVLH